MAPILRRGLQVGGLGKSKKSDLSTFGSHFFASMTQVATPVPPNLQKLWHSK
jgi:hypothetical protein